MNVYVMVCLFIIGGLVGSFYHVLGTRLANNLSIVSPRSHCLNCQKKLKWYDLIPIISFISLRGKCRYCGKYYGIDTFLVELVMALAFPFFYWYYGLSYNYFVILIIFSLLVLIFLTDLKYMIILDSPLIIGSLLIMVLKLLYYDYQEMLIGILSGIFLFLFMLFLGFLGTKIFKRESLGGGDIKLSFVIGLTLNIPLGLTAIILSTFLALPLATYSLLKDQEHEVPYGPFLISGLFIVFLFQDKFLILLNFLLP